MKFLHVSDIHFNPVDDGRATRDLRKKFQKYTEEKHITNVDEVFFTGDFRHARNQAGQDKNIVAQNAVNFLCDIAECVGVTKLEHIHIVPGNHDLEREADSKINTELLDSVYKQYDPDEGRFWGYINNNIMTLDYLRSRFDFYEKCVSLLNNKVWFDFKGGLIHRCQNFDDYSILYINTAIASGRNADRHNLLIDTNDFDKVLHQTDGRPIIVLAHNPLSHLEHNEQNTVKNMLRDNKAPVLWLCGDVHETQYDKNYEIACLSAGCMIQQSGTEASFFVGEITKYNGVVINAHRYVAKHGLWQPEEAITKRVNESIPADLKPPPSANMPKINNLLERNVYFTGRDKQLKAIADKFSKDQKVVVKQTISGLGGVGKTQLVREFAYQYSGKYKTAIWEINAESSITAYMGFVEFSKKLNLQLSDDFEKEELYEVIKMWMQNNDGWLIIFDNLDYEDIILPYIPYNNICGDILITTRSTAINIGQYIDLSVFELEEAIKFLDNRLEGCSHIEWENEYVKIELVERLGRLPLALEQASAYIKATRTNYSRYLDLLCESGLKAFDFDETSYSKPEYYVKSVTTTWKISFSAIALESSKQLFFLCAYLAPNKIPIKIFSEWREKLPNPIQGDLSTILSTNKIVTELRRYSLIGGDSEYIYIHRLVQELVRNSLDTDTQWAKDDLMILSNIFEFEYGNVTSHENFLEYITHVETFVSTSNLTDTDDKLLISSLCNTAGCGYNYLGDYNQALSWHEIALNIRESILGTNHLLVAVSSNNIAAIYENQGEYNRALEGYQKALGIFESELGQEDLAVATAYNNIAGVYDNLGDYSGSMKLYQKALIIREKQLGSEHRDIADIYNNIAFVFSRQGKYDEALEYQEKVQIIQEKNYGKENLRSATCYSNIAYIYVCQGKYSEGLSWHERALDIREKVLGKDNPETLVSYMNIAYVYSIKGDYPKSLDLYFYVMYIYEELFGKKHPETATIYNNIGGVYDRIGNYSKALQFHNKALDIRKNKLGINHPYTASSYNNIASVYENQGNNIKALKYYQKALNIRLKVLGNNHLDTAESYNNIAILYDSLGDYTKALELYQKALTIREKVLGKEHPDTATTYNNIAAVFSAIGHYTEALELYRIALENRIKTLGNEHSDTAATYNNIAEVYCNQGDFTEAFKMYQVALDIYQKVFGEKHPDTATICNNIGVMFDGYEDYLKALEWLQRGGDIREKVLGKKHFDTADSYNNIAAVYERLGNYIKALEFYEKALVVFQIELGSDHEYTKYIQGNIYSLKDLIANDKR